MHDHLASWLSGLTTVHGLAERLSGTTTLGDALSETLRAGAGLLGARRGLLTLLPADGLGPHRVIGHGLGHADLGHLQTVPPGPSEADGAPAGEPAGEPPSRTPPFGTAAGPDEAAYPDLAHDSDLTPRHREVAARLGFAASYAVPLAAGPPPPGGPPAGRLGAAAWLFDEPGAPEQRQRHLLALYLRHAAQHIAHRLELARARSAMRAVHDGLLSAALPAPPGVALAVRRRSGPRGGGGFYDALALPDGSLTLAIGTATGTGPAALAAMGRLRAGLRAYAVMEGEDPVAVLSDLELLMRLTEPGSSATALFCHAESPGPARRRLVLASAGHPPPLIVGAAHAEFAETTLSAPLGMLACWEAPSLRLTVAERETVLLYSDGLLRRTGQPRDTAFDRLRSAAATAGPAVRADPGALLDHLLDVLAPAAADGPEEGPEDVILLAARF